MPVIIRDPDQFNMVIFAVSSLNTVVPLHSLKICKPFAFFKMLFPVKLNTRIMIRQEEIERQRFLITTIGKPLLCRIFDLVFIQVGSDNRLTGTLLAGARITLRHIMLQEIVERSRIFISAATSYSEVSF